MAQTKSVFLAALRVEDSHMKASSLMQAVQRLALPLCVIAALVPAHAHADDLRTIYELAIENDPQIGAAEANYMALREGVTQARAGILPFAQLSGNTTHGRRFSPQPFVDTNPTSPTFGEIISSHGPTQRFNNHSWNAVINQSVFDVSRFFQWRQSKNLEAQAAAPFEEIGAVLAALDKDIAAVWGDSVECGPALDA